MGDESRSYNAKFYRALEATRDSAREMLPLVCEFIRPASVVDVGCGAGHWLAEALKLGVSDVLGVDGEWALKAKLRVPREKFLVHDLTKPLNLERRFDLAISLEVAEHLPSSQAEEFVRILCQAADVVFFSAAIPGQGGRHHVNEQWPAYWAKLFAAHGLKCYDVLRTRIWNNEKVLWYYAQNCFLFARPGLLKNCAPTTEPLALVHPRLWLAQVERMNSPGKLLERMAKAAIRKLKLSS
jgi:SAM-dependent methyltransferase